MDNNDLFLLDAGFEKVTTNQYMHITFGYIHLPNNYTEKDIALAIFNLGKNRKCEEVSNVLGLKLK
jgi:hypothetical protein